MLLGLCYNCIYGVDHINNLFSNFNIIIIIFGSTFAIKSYLIDQIIGQQINLKEGFF